MQLALPLLRHLVAYAILQHQQLPFGSLPAGLRTFVTDEGTRHVKSCAGCAKWQQQQPLTAEEGEELDLKTIEGCLKVCTVDDVKGLITVCRGNMQQASLD